MTNKTLILLPDGVGLRNFAFTNFYKVGVLDNSITYWNNTVFPLNKEFGYEELKLNNKKVNVVSDIFKRARKEIELKQNIINFKDSTYQNYTFPKSYKTPKTAIKSILVSIIVWLYNSKNGLLKIRRLIHKFERKTLNYKKAKSQLEKERPSMVLCTNQRPILGVSAMLAAQDLGIPTATFIFSWDNVPKGTLVIEADFYFVWSQHMKNEMLSYYPHITENQIKIVGTPQFEPHFDINLYQSKESFFNEHKLDLDKKYICFSGDDITTSPYDQYYLEDLAKTVQKMNIKGNNLGIIFRRCPVDFSDRYDKILDKYKNLIKPINPDWKSYGNDWNKVMPTPNDFKLLINTVKHTEFVVNVGSSMVFDYASHKKPCIYIKYNHSNVDVNKWDIKKIYQYIHFRSMPSHKSVFWFDDKKKMENILNKALFQPDDVVQNAIEWFKIINIKNPEKASENIWSVINKISQCT